MASLIWEPVGFIGNQVKLRVKMSDDSNMHDNSEGVSFMGVINGTSPYIPCFKEFRWSLGFGHQNYNYDDFWIPASESSQYGDYFGSLGNGYGVVRIGHEAMLPYMNYVNKHMYQSSYMIGEWSYAKIKCTWWYWEVYGMSAIVHLPIKDAHGSAVPDYWHPTIAAWRGINNLGFLPYFYDHVFGIGNDPSDLFGPAPFTNYGGSDAQAIPPNAVDNYNILISTVLHLGDEDGSFLNIECAESSAIDDTVYLPGGNTRYAFAPVHFTTSIYDLTPNFIDVSSPSYVNEGESAAFQIEINPADYRGAMQVYLLDSTSVDTINEEIGTELEEFYGLIQDDVVAQYGILEFLDSDDTHIKTIQVTDSSVIEVPISYTASNINAGQRDRYSIFVRFNEFDFTAITSDLYDTQYQWDLIPLQNRYIYREHMRIDVLDVNQEFVEDYDPSDVLITQPADIVHHLLSEELGFDKNKIDTLSKRESREQNEGLGLAFSINEEIKGKELIKGISQSFKSIPTLSNDKLKFITIKDTYSGDEDIFTIKADDVINYNISRTAMEDVKTKVNVKYKKDYGMNTYLESSEAKVNELSYFLTSAYKDAFGNTGFSNYYGVKALGSEINHVDTFLDIENDYIRDYLPASKLAYHLLQWHKNQHNIISLKLPLKYYGFEIGDLINFDEMIKGRRLYGENYVLSDRDDSGVYQDMPIRCGQYILPLFMITETNKSLDSISIKAIQLHHQLGTNLIWEGVNYASFSDFIFIQNGETEDTTTPPDVVEPGSGDVSGDGFVNVLDVVQTILGIVDETTDTWEGDKFSAADMNSDGSINVLDVVIMVNQIIGN